ncbi:MAG: hypothetical protein JOZ75_05590, partial [Candidatus Dormibacteraeota bacterium]|nr:hypothetical protein [Candidatus Dormibacteraeota bacterium]
MVAASTPVEIEVVDVLAGAVPLLVDEVPGVPLLVELVEELLPGAVEVVVFVVVTVVVAGLVSVVVTVIVVGLVSV